MTGRAASGRVVVAGHICVDLLPALDRVPAAAPGRLSGIGPLAVRPGGCVANTGRTLAALRGEPVQLVADIGDDALGDLLRQRLASGTGAALAGLRPVAGATTSYSIVLDVPGRDRTVWHHVGANAGFDAHQVEPAGAELVHLGYPSVLPALVPDDRAGPLAAFLARCRAAGATTSLDLATVDTGAAAGPVRDWRAVFQTALPLTDVLSPSVDDLTTAVGASSPPAARELGRELLRLGAGVVLVTAGAGGMQLLTGSADRLAAAGRAVAPLAGRWAGVDLSVPASPGPVVTTTGAGDAATAGLLAGILAGLDPPAALGLAAEVAARHVRGPSV